MNQADRKRIKFAFVQLVNALFVDEVCDYLFQYNVISDEEMEEVVSLDFQKTKKERVRTLLRILMKNSQPGVLATFCRVLRECDGGYGWLADILENCDISSMPDVDEVDSGSNERKKDELVKTLTQQAYVLQKANEEYKRQIAKLEEKNSVHQQRAASLEILKQNGFEDQSLLEFIDTFVLAKTVDPNRLQRQMSGAGDAYDLKSRILGKLHLDGFPQESLTACQLAVDLVHYVVAMKCGREPPKPFCDYAKQLRKMVKETIEKHETVFENALQKLDIQEIEGFKTFSAVADELFLEGQCNWGRVVSWFAFCSYTARGFPETSLGGTLDMYGTYTWYFLDQRLSKWIAEVGGWGDFLKFVERPMVPAGLVETLSQGFLWLFQQYVQFLRS